MKWALWLVIPAALAAGTLYWVLAREGDQKGRAENDEEKPASVSHASGSHMAKAVELSKGCGIDAVQ